jgi:hypothetical protein
MASFILFATSTPAEIIPAKIRNTVFLYRGKIVYNLLKNAHLFLLRMIIKNILYVIY